MNASSAIVDRFRERSLRLMFENLASFFRRDEVFVGQATACFLFPYLSGLATIADLIGKSGRREISTSPVFRVTTVTDQFPESNRACSEHYLIFDRSEESPDEPVAGMANVYLERDDQGWGGYGGIESVTLGRSHLTFQLTPKMAKTMGDHKMIRVTFDVANEQWGSIRSVASLIMKGYESQLVIDS